MERSDSQILVPLSRGEVAGNEGESVGSMTVDRPLSAEEHAVAEWLYTTRRRRLGRFCRNWKVLA